MPGEIAPPIKPPAPRIEPGISKGTGFSQDHLRKMAAADEAKGVRLIGQTPDSVDTSSTSAPGGQETVQQGQAAESTAGRRVAAEPQTGDLEIQLISPRAFLAVTPEASGDNGRFALEIITGRAASGIGEARLVTYRRDLQRFKDPHTGKSLPGVQIEGEVKTLKDAVVRKQKEVAKAITRLSSSEDPHQRALGFDLERHLIQDELRSLTEAQKVLAAAGESTAAVDAKIAKIQVTLSEKVQQRVALKDAAGVDIPDQLAGGVRSIIEAADIKMTPAQVTELADNPLGVMEDVLKGVISNPATRDQMIGTLIKKGFLTNAQAKELEHAAQLIGEKGGVGTILGKYAFFFAIAGVAAAWAASQAESGGGPGGGHG